MRPHKGIRNLIDDLNSLYKNEPALWRNDFDPYGFQWIDCNDKSNSVISFMRRENDTNEWPLIGIVFSSHETYHRIRFVITINPLKSIRIKVISP